MLDISSEEVSHLPSSISCDIEAAPNKKTIYSFLVTKKTALKQKMGDLKEFSNAILLSSLVSQSEQQRRGIHPADKSKRRIDMRKNGNLFRNKLINRSLKQRSIEQYVQSKTQALNAYCDKSRGKMDKLKQKQKKMISNLKLRPLSFSAHKHTL